MVLTGVLVAVSVGVLVKVLVGVAVAVWVGVALAVLVGVAVGVCVGQASVSALNEEHPLQRPCPPTYGRRLCARHVVIDANPNREMTTRETKLKLKLVTGIVRRTLRVCASAQMRLTARGARQSEEEMVHRGA